MPDDGSNQRGFAAIGFFNTRVCQFRHPSEKKPEASKSRAKLKRFRPVKFVRCQEIGLPD
jgi:hypothetical protein